MKETRPNLADSYGIQPAADGTGLIPWSETTDRLATSRNYWFASADREGNPHSTPIWAVWLEDRLFFGTDPNSKKAHNIGANPQTVVHLESGDDVVILHCLVETESDPETVTKVIEAYRSKYDLPTSFSFSPVLTARPFAAYAWEEVNFPGTATKYTE